MNRQEIKDTIKLAREHPPYREDPNFSFLLAARIGAPVLVHSPGGEPAFWMAPFLVRDLACGCAQVNLDGRVTRIGIFGGSANDRSAWIRASYFKTPAPEHMAEIASRYSGATLSEPIFSYDRTPARWAWMVTVNRANSAPMVVFITPRSWYEQQLSEPPVGFEG